MFHLPDDNRRVKVWPTPGLRVASSEPRIDVDAPPPMGADGQVVTWSGFRYRQYLSGELHFFDPRAKSEDPKEAEARAERAKADEKHEHRPKHPAWLQKLLQKDCAHPEQHRGEKARDCGLCGLDAKSIDAPKATAAQPTAPAAKGKE